MIVIRLILFIALSMCTLGKALQSQELATLTGEIKDKSTSEKLGHATVQLSDLSNQRLITGAIADENGRFIIAGIQHGKYELACSFLGYKTFVSAISIGEKNMYYDFGQILLEIEPNQLGEVLVSGERGTVEKGLDKKSFNIGDQIAQAGGTVLDAMKMLPGITVDQEGNLLLRGSNQVAILIDGKQSAMTGYGNQRGLNNIPAVNIERIEIINNPSAKYDASGMAGIINIIYKKEKEVGWNGAIGIAVGLGELTSRKSDLPTSLGRYNLNPKYIPSVSLNYRTPQSQTFFQAEILQQKKLPNNEFTTRLYGDGARTISAVPENRKQTHYIVKAGRDWFINDNNTFQFSAVWDYESHVDTAQVPYIDLLTNRRYRYWHWREAEVTGFLNFQLAYNYEFEEPGHELDLSLQYSRGWEDESYFLNDSSAIRQGNDMTHIIATEHTSSVSLDYTRPMRNGRIEMGSKLQIRSIPVTYDVNRGQESIIYEGIGDWSKWGENLYAGYVNFTIEKEILDIEGGLRLEHTDVFYNISPENIYYPENDAYNYFRLFPNIRLTFNLDGRNNLSLFYNNRVDRPGEPNLRIFPKYDDPELLKVGNPYVRPQFTQTYEIAYKRIWESGSIFLAGYYRNIESPFQRIYSIDNSNSNYNIINKIYHNVGDGSNLGTEILISQTINDNWKISSSFNWYNNKIDAFTGTLLFPTKRAFIIDASSDQTWDFKLNNQVTLPGDLEVQLTGIYMASKNIPQGRQDARSSIDIGIKKTILNRRGTITISVSDLLNDFGIRQEIIDKEFTTIYENYYETQVVRVGLSYKL